MSVDAAQHEGGNSRGGTGAVAVRPQCVFVPERGCRATAVEQAAAAFARFVADRQMPVDVEVGGPAVVEGPWRSGAPFLVVRTMEGQEQLGRHVPVEAGPHEVYVELASYLYGCAPTPNIIKFECDAVQPGHRLTVVFFELLAAELLRMVPAPVESRSGCPRWPNCTIS